jgi:VWFA-related protein
MRLLLAGLFATAIGLAQSKPDDPELIRSITKLVQVNIVVQEDGKPVDNLKAEDFTLTERGKVQKIAFFSLERLGVDAEPKVKLPPNVFSNRISGRAGVPTSVTAILIDTANTEWADQAFARKHIINFLKQVKSEDRIALYSLGRSLQVLHDYTTDSAELVAKLNKYRGAVDSDLAASGVKSLDELKADTGIQDDKQLAGLMASLQNEAMFATQNRVQRTLQAIEAISEHLAGVPGRKTLVWVSAAFPMWLQMTAPSASPAFPSTHETRSFGDEVTRTVRALNDANIAVYPVDARGLMADPRLNAENKTSPPNSSWTVPNLETMIEIANQTGGRAFYNNNDIQRSVRQAIEDSRVTYTIAYYPSDTKMDDKYRTIQVKVNRPGVKVRHRRGYIAAKDRVSSAKSLDDELNQTIWSPMEATAIGLNARVDRAKGSDSLETIIQIDPRGLALEQSGDRWKAAIVVAYLQRDGTGKQLAGMKEEFTFNLSKPNYLHMMKAGLVYRKVIKHAPGASALKVALVDKATGLTGSLTMPLTGLDEYDSKAAAPAPPAK